MCKEEVTMRQMTERKFQFLWQISASEVNKLWQFNSSKSAQRKGMSDGLYGIYERDTGCIYNLQDKN